MEGGGCKHSRQSRCRFRDLCVKGALSLPRSLEASDVLKTGQSKPFETDGAEEDGGRNFADRGECRSVTNLFANARAICSSGIYGFAGD